MLISELAKEIHANAVAHGWWEAERPDAEVFALIHSEWSEALEEARAGRPLVWYAADVRGVCWRAGDCHPSIGFDGKCGGVFSGTEHPILGGCPKMFKPEGVAVELMDGVIRILDYLGKMGETLDALEDFSPDIESLYGREGMDEMPASIAETIGWLHYRTSMAMDGSYTALMRVMSLALSWVKLQGLDPLRVLLEKHEYNKGRPYKHGKLF